MSLPALPDEVVTRIIIYLVPDLDVPLGCYEDTFSSPSSSFVQGRRALLSLVKSSRRLCAVATSYLYRTICVYDVRGLFMLLRSLITRPEHAQYVRVLVILADLFLTPNSAIEAEAARAMAAIPEESKVFTYLQPCFGEFEHVGELNYEETDDFIEGACGLLLCLTAHLETLYLQCPNWNVGEYDHLSAIPRKCLEEGLECVPHLSQLFVVADPEACSPALADDLPQPLMVTGSVKDVRLFGGCLREDQTPSMLAVAWRNVESIQVKYGYTEGSWWYEMCRLAKPRLTHISIDLSPYSDLPDTQPAYGLDDGLLLCANTLETLHLMVSRHTNFGHLLGPQKRLSCLASMTRLTELAVSIPLLFESPAAMRDRKIYDILPPSLQTLELDEEESCDEDPWKLAIDGEEERLAEYKSSLPLVLRDLIHESGGKLPKLQEVRLTILGLFWKEGVPGLESNVSNLIPGERGKADYVVFSFASKRRSGIKRE